MGINKESLLYIIYEICLVQFRYSFHTTPTPTAKAVV